MPLSLKLIAGLGNPGPRYTETRHNAGFWFLDWLAQEYHARLSHMSRFHAELARVDAGDDDYRLLKPGTWMNESGRAIAAVSSYYDIEPGQMLIAHDEIDLPAGVTRLKQGGGHGGHNGLRDIIQQTGSNGFLRLRIGVGHPGNRDEVVDYVLHKPSAEERKLIDDAIGRAIQVIPLVLNGELNKAMTQLNGSNKL